jgi:CheY-like chemotaxis protein
VKSREPARATLESVIGVPALSAPDPVLLRPVDDDRDRIEPGDRVLLIIEDDLPFARIMLGMAHENGYKAVVATRGDSGLALANQLKPDAISLDLQLPVIDGWSVLDRLKRNPATRHIPVHVISVDELTRRGAALGAFAYLEKPVSREVLQGAFQHISTFLDRSVRKLLLVEDDDNQRESIIELVGEGEDVQVTAVRTADEALGVLENGGCDCMVVDLVLPGDDGIRLVEQVRNQPRYRDLPIVVYTGKELTDEEEQQLKKYTQSIILKSGLHSPERLLKDTALFLHRIDGRLPERSKAMITESSKAEVAVVGKKVLVIDDDVRNIFAMTSILEANGVKVIYADNGRAGIDALENDPRVDLVLMDIMMPGMDGYQAIKEIRGMPRFRSLPIVAVTAKALREDRDKCLGAGASDYLPKPVDANKLLDVIRLWTGGDAETLS